jgi:hypothetical protein
MNLCFLFMNPEFWYKKEMVVFSAQERRVKE